MKKFMLFLLLTTVFISCQKDNEEAEDTGIRGVYAGTFNRSGMDTVSVQLTFTKDGFSGISSREKYPAICGGTYLIEGNMITFSDTCAWTADFDWSLILDGNYIFEQPNENDIRIHRTNGTVSDQYQLSRIER